MESPRRPRIATDGSARSRLGGRTLLVVVALVAVVAAACGGGGNSDDESSAGTTPGSGASSATAPESSGGWTFTDDAGITHQLDEVPKVIVAESTSAGGLWEYGIVAKGVFGPTTRSDGTPDPSIGRADPDDFESLGKTAADVNVEAIIGMRPDIIVTGMWDEDDYWGMSEANVASLRKVAPIVGIRVDNRAIDEPLARYAELAESLGADEAKVDAAKKEFETASDELRASVKENPGVTFIGASGSPSEMYIAYPPAFSDLRYMQELGLDIVEPKTHATAGGFWETLSWEEAGRYPADVVFADARGGTMKEIMDFLPPAAKKLAPIEAGQIMAWPAAIAFGYGNVSDVLDDVRAMLEKADPDIA